VMYRTAELRKYQYFISPNWPGGVYASPTLAGSRYAFSLQCNIKSQSYFFSSPGALIAGAWVVMQHFGHE